MTEKVGMILNQIKKELEGIKNELKNPMHQEIKDTKNGLKWKKNGKKLIVNNLIIRHHVF